MITGGVKVKLRDGVYTLRYDTAAFMALEESSGLTLGEVQSAMTKLSVRTIVSIVWAGLLHAEPKLTVATVADRIDLKDLEPIAEAVGKGFEHAFGEIEATDDDEGNASRSAG